MKFGMFYEHPLSGTATRDQRSRAFTDALDQAVLADQLGFESLWALDRPPNGDSIHSSAPEMFLSACSQRTQRIRLGLCKTQVPTNSLETAEKVALIDLVSTGRAEFGVAGPAAATKLEFDAWLACCRQATRALTDSSTPNTVQQPHPPLWLACSNRQMVRSAARLGCGALLVTPVEPWDAARWVDEYYATLKEECVPLGQAINANFAITIGMFCHREPTSRFRRVMEGASFVGFGLAHVLLHGRRADTNLWREFKQQPAAVHAFCRGTVGTPDQLRFTMGEYASAGVDQVLVVQQGNEAAAGPLADSIELFATEVMPEFQASAAHVESEKRAELVPYLDQAWVRKERLESTEEHSLPTSTLPLSKSEYRRAA